MKKIYTLLFALLISVQLFAGGFQINEQGAKAMAMADAFTGIANNPSAIFFNPAGITQLNGTQFLGGVSLIAPSAKFIGPSPLTTEWKMENQIFTPFDIYATHQFSDRFFAGLGVNNQYGLGTKWPQDWIGNQLAVETNIKSFFFTPVIAYKFSDQFSLSAGAVIAYADVKIMNSIEDPLTGKADVLVDLTGNKTGFGFTAGLMYKPINELSLGLSYRSKVKFDFAGTATSTPAGFTYPGVGFIPFPNGDISAPLTTPQNITFGIGIMPSPDLTLAADFQYVGWSSYDKLEITFKNYDLDPLTPGVQSTESIDRKYKNTFIVRGGAEYKFSDVFALRGGIYFDKNPIKDEYVEPQLPDGNRIGFNLGFGYKFTPNFGVDFAYLLLTVADRQVTNSVFGFNGTYKNFINIVGLDFSYNL